MCPVTVLFRTDLQSSGSKNLTVVLRFYSFKGLTSLPFTVSCKTSESSSYLVKKVESAESNVGSALNGSTIMMKFDLSGSLIYEHEKCLC